MNGEIRKIDLMDLQREDLQAARGDAEINHREKLERLKRVAAIDRRVLWTDQPSRDGIYRRGPTRSTR